MTGNTKSGGRLERVLRAGQFALTAETTPPLTADPEVAIDRVRPLSALADAVNVTSGARARTHLSTLATAGLLARVGIEPVMQFTTRDHNLLSLQAEILGAAALGTPNILCLHGDSIEAGDEPSATAVHDLDSTALASLARRMRDDGETRSGRKIEPAPRIFIGMADTPTDPGAEWSADRLKAKLAAGADFFQTQYCFDMAVCRRYMARLADEGITESAYFLIGTAPFASAKQARWMDENLYGVHVPAAIVRRLDGAADQAAEGQAIGLEMLQQLQDIPGVAGAHIMAPGAEARAAAMIAACGIIDRRRASA
ncbi:MAG: methylenetetrahydrofolate reductase [Alphaproteobacteria bacterium]|nr:methylenetetrahydrofolate reductase [Alphaproteobacteria bacterium]